MGARARSAIVASIVIGPGHRCGHAATGHPDLYDQLEFVRVYETQPTFYLTIVGIGMAEAVEDGPQALRARLNNLPAFLDQAARNLTHVPRLFRDMGIDMLVKQAAMAGFPVPA
jgi:hypothetical protein